MQSFQLSRPHAIMMVGVPGSGKSQFAEKLAETFGMPYIDSLFLETHSTDDASAGELIGYVLGEITKTGASFVFEGNSDSRVRRTEFVAWAKSKHYIPLFIWVQTDLNTSLERTLRNKTMTKDEFVRTLKTFSPPHESEKAVVISGKHTYASQVKVVLKRLGELNRPSQEIATSSVRSAERPAARAPRIVRS